VTRFWIGWLVATGVVYGVLWALLVALDTDPRPERLLLLVTLATAVLALANLAARTDSADWEVHSVGSVTPPGQDPRLGMYTRVIAGHLDARTTDPALRDRLAALAGRRLRQRHGIDLWDPADTPQVDRLVGAEVREVLVGPPRHLGRAEIETCVRMIEGL